jgi:hypothetical protein
VVLLALAGRLPVQRQVPERARRVLPASALVSRLGLVRVLPWVPDRPD